MAAASPMKKKMSLSDYTKRSKAKDHPGPGPAASASAGGVVKGKTERESSPASVASAAAGGEAAVVPPLKGATSEHAVAETEEDVGMGDAPAA